MSKKLSKEEKIMQNKNLHLDNQEKPIPKNTYNSQIKPSKVRSNSNYSSNGFTINNNNLALTSDQSFPSTS